MASGQTEHYGLSQWAAEDSFLREEFNEDFRKIDGGLAAAPNIVTGTFAGDGESERFISLGVTPYVVITFSDGVIMDSYETGGGIAIGRTLVTWHGHRTLQIEEGGFRVYGNNYVSTNRTGKAYGYIAIYTE